MRTLDIFAHSRDCTSITYTDSNGNRHPYDGYVPEGLGIGGGDDIEMQIDLDTGQILNWKAPIHKEVMEALKLESEEAA